MKALNHWFVLLALIASAPGFAQKAAPAPAPKPPEPKLTPAQEKLKEAGENGLVGDLKKHCAGLPVVAVEPLNNNWASPLDEKELPTKLLERLQVISERHTNENDPIIPFRIRHSWTLAPEQRDEVLTDFSGVTWMDFTRAGDNLRLLLAELTPAQIRRLGDANGLALTELSPRARELASDLLRPPFSINHQIAEEGADDDGRPVKSNATEEVEQITEPVDLRSVRIRAGLKVIQISYQISENSSSTTMARDSDEGTYLVFDRNAGANPGITRVPNTFKPSDLDGRRLTAPIGISGTMSLDDLLKRASAVTGLKLKPTGEVGDTPVFIGAATMPVGDVLDSVRLGLRATFRRLGDSWLLCWDRRGVAALQQAIEEGTKNALRETNRMRTSSEFNLIWADIALTLPFDANNPLALTDAQREKLYGAESVNGSDRPGAERGISFNEMTSQQQAYVLKSVVNEKLHYPEEMGGPKQGTPEDAQRSRIGENLFVSVSLFIPGKGWLSCERNWDPPQISLWQIRNARRRQSNKSGVPTDIPPEILEMLKNPEPMMLDGATRGFIVPALGPTRLTSLAKEMANRGLNTLFYPVLFNGYATVPSKVFPQEPGMKEIDLFSRAAAIMKTAGIKVVPYVNTLTWQNLGSTNHWMNRHKDWWDVDIRGRTALECIEAQPLIALSMPYNALTPANWVRASEPMVSTKLLAFIDEITERKDMAGLAFLDWSHENSSFFGLSSGSHLKLGFSLPDRIEAFQRTGQDPVDDSGIQSREIRPFLADPMYPAWAGSNAVKSTSPPNWILMKSLLDKVKAKQKNWTIYLIETGGFDFFRSKSATSAKPPAGDISLSAPFSMSGDPGPKTVLVLPISNDNLYTLMTAHAEEDAMDEFLEDTGINLLADKPSISIYSIMFAEMAGQLGPGQIGGMLLDFRSAPEQITPSLPFIAKVKPTSAKPKPPPEAPQPATEYAFEEP